MGRGGRRVCGWLGWFGVSWGCVVFWGWESPDRGVILKAVFLGGALGRGSVSGAGGVACFYGYFFPISAAAQLRVSKEQEHFLVAPQGLACSEVTAASLVSPQKPTHTPQGGTPHSSDRPPAPQVKVNVLGAVVEPGSTGFSPDTRSFGLHAAIYAARPDARCIVHLHTPATAAVRRGERGGLFLGGGVLVFRPGVPRVPP